MCKLAVVAAAAAAFAAPFSSAPEKTKRGADEMLTSSQTLLEDAVDFGMVASHDSVSLLTQQVGVRGGIGQTADCVLLQAQKIDSQLVEKRS